MCGRVRRVQRYADDAELRRGLPSLRQVVPGDRQIRSGAKGCLDSSKSRIESPVHAHANFSEFYPGTVAETATRFSFGRSTASTAARNSEMPSNAKPPCRFPVFLLITPRTYGPTKPPRFPIEL